MFPMNPMARPSGSLGFPRMGAPAQSPPIMAPGAVPAPANTGIVPPAPAVPQNVPVSVVGAPAPAPAPTGVMPTNPAAAAVGHGRVGTHGPSVRPDGMGQQHIPALVAKMPGMTDLLHQYFASGGNMRDVRQQFRGAMHDYNQTGQPGSIFADSMHGGTGLTDYLKAHLTTPPATGGA